MSLSERLRAAALERAEASGQVIDGVVLEPSGVIDLRTMARDADREIDHCIELPRLPDAVVREALEVRLTPRSRWRRNRPSRLPLESTVIDLDAPTVSDLES